MNDFAPTSDSSRLERIESAVAQLLELIVSAQTHSMSSEYAGPQFFNANAAGHFQSQKRTDPALEAEATLQENDSAERDSILSHAAEAIKTGDQASFNKRYQTESATVEILVNQYESTENYQLTAPTAPSPVEHDSDSETLLEAIHTRDAYIVYLTSRLRTAERMFRDEPARMISLNTNAEHLEQQLIDHLKQAEIASSLERACLARQRTRLRISQKEFDELFANLLDAKLHPERLQETQLEARWRKYMDFEKLPRTH